jgi:membrane-bound serine protease (ClpP class)
MFFRALAAAVGCLAAVLLAVVALPASAHAADAPVDVPVIELSGTIDPATAGWIDEALREARDERAPLAIVRVDTPGGLSESMREIVQAIVRAPMPVVVHVAPDGARAASAGLFVTLAADVAAMAPQTNIGSATPVSLGGGETSEVLGRKVRNDAVAYARALAEAHDRNADLAERMVRRAENVTAREAADRGLIEIVAADTHELLAELDGRELTGTPGRTLDTEGLVPVERDMPLQYEIQQILVNPNIAYVLLLAGLFGLAIELLTPGLMGPGVFGAVALLLGLYGTAQLPVTAAGIVLLILGVALLGTELAVAAGGIAAAAGAVSLAAGGLLLYDTDSQAVAVSLSVAATVGATLGLVTVFALSKAFALRRSPARGGAADLVGAIGTVRTPLEPEGHVAVAGELWRAQTHNGSVPVGERVRVNAVTGLTLSVEPTNPETEEVS